MLTRWVHVASDSGKCRRGGPSHGEPVSSLRVRGGKRRRGPGEGRAPGGGGRAPVTPFPEGLSPNIPAAEYAGEPRATAIAKAARRLVELRDRWLNPPEWVQWIDEPVPGFPRRAVARGEAPEKELKKRTLTNLYNTRPQWLVDAHKALDAAVAGAYGWDPEIPSDDALQTLLELNRRRSA